MTNLADIPFVGPLMKPTGTQTKGRRFSTNCPRGTHRAGGSSHACLKRKNKRSSSTKRRSYRKRSSTKKRVYRKRSSTRKRVYRKRK